MKRYKRLGILVGVLVIACIATFALTRYEEKKEQISNSDEVILEIPTDSVQSLSWEYESESLAFHKEETWLYDEDEAFPVDEEKVNELLEQFEAFGVSFVIEEVEDYSQYGLAEPVCTIHLSTEDTSYEIKLGDFSKMDSKRYVDIGDENVYLVSNDPLDQFDVALSDLIDHDEMPIFDQVTQIRFTGTESYSISYEEESNGSYSADDVYFTQEGNPLDTSRVESYLKALSSLDATDYVTYNATEEELQAYGLNAPELTVTVDYTYENEDGESVPDTFALNISRDPEELAAAEEGEDGDISAYVRVGESQIVYRVSSDDRQALMAVSYDDLRHQEVFWADFDDVYQLDITLEGTQHTLTAVTQDGERAWYYGVKAEEVSNGESEEAEATDETLTEDTEEEQQEALDITGLQSALEALSADSFTSETPTEKEEISLTVYLDNENFPKVQIGLYRYDGTYCLAVVDGESVSLVARSSVMELVEAVQVIVLN
ncbi:MAG: DUF4340 domain-containing protein [Eubacteriales bacterium]|nr:DUF4340 domain-containing protein [Eubacteriales bacterium]